MNTLRIASYNIRKSIGGDWRRDTDRTLDVVAELDADIVALQEADYRFKGRQALFELEQIQQKTGLVLADIDHTHAGLGWHGNLLLHKPHLKRLDTQALELPGFEPRGAISVKFGLEDSQAGENNEMSNRQFAIVAAHLGLLSHDRHKQLDTMVCYLRESADKMPAILMGDFNVIKIEAKSIQQLKPAFQDAMCGHSYPAKKPKLHLDRIFYTPEFKLQNSYVHDSELAQIASDHRPIVADFTLL